MLESPNKQPGTKQVIVKKDETSLLNALTEYVFSLHTNSIEKHGGFSVSLAGGSSPRALYRLWASDAWRTRFRWDRIRLYFGDERCVPHDHPESNYRMLKESFLSQFDDSEHVKRPIVYPIETSLPPLDAALRYAESLSHALPSNEHGMPVFDLVLLGMGSDGHTASVFDRELFENSYEPTAVTEHPQTGQKRISLTPQVFNAARNVVFLVYGANKAEAVRRNVASDSPDPAGLIHPANGSLTWYLDRAAAARLSRAS